MKRARREKKSTAGYRTTDFRGRTRYECTACPQATLDEAAMRAHVAHAHAQAPTPAPEALQSARSAVSEPPGAAPVDRGRIYRCAHCPHATLDAAALSAHEAAHALPAGSQLKPEALRAARERVAAPARSEGPTPAELRAGRERTPPRPAPKGPSPEALREGRERPAEPPKGETYPPDTWRGLPVARCERCPHSAVGRTAAEAAAKLVEHRREHDTPPPGDGSPIVGVERYTRRPVTAADRARRLGEEGG